MAYDIKENLENDPYGLATDAVKRYNIVEYGMDLISNPADAAYVPSLFIAGTDASTLAKKATAIVYFHESTATGTPSYDAQRDTVYIHYPLSLFESIMNLLRSKDPLQFYWKRTGTKQWSGINFKNLVKKSDGEIYP